MLVDPNAITNTTLSLAPIKALRFVLGAGPLSFHHTRSF